MHGTDGTQHILAIIRRKSTEMRCDTDRWLTGKDHLEDVRSGHALLSANTPGNERLVLRGAEYR